jgi:DNA polymerase-3 subunit gamma/tau
LRLLAQGAQGSMRDALSLTDQAIAYAAGKVTLEAVQAMLGTLDHAYLVSLMDALAAQDGASLLAVADDMAERSLSYHAALQDLGTLLNRIAMAQSVPAAIPDDLPEREDILRLAGMFGPEDIQLFYQIVTHGRHELGLAPDEYAGFTMTLLRMLAFTPLWSGGQSGSPVAQPAVRPVVKSAASENSRSSAPAALAPTASTAALPATATAAKSPSPAMAALAAARSGKAGAAASRAVKTEPAQETKPEATDTAAAAQKKTDIAPAPALKTEPVLQLQPSAALPGWDGNWPALARLLPLRGVVQQLASQSELLGCDSEDGALVMRLRVPVETLLTAGSSDKLATALSEYFSQPIKLETAIGTVAHTAHAQILVEQASRQQAAEDSMQNDPFVQTLIREFGASIVPGSIKPV